ncbi:MAG TPA: 3-hydroxyacyl-CoA dehydrogenase NAD-binding domain-containing protein [Opitutaceae bacterium]
MTAPVTYSVDAAGVGWIIFDHPTARANVFNAPTLAALDTAITELTARPTLKGIVVCGAKDRIFIAGADLADLSNLSDAAEAAAYSVRGQKLLSRLQEMRVPVVAAIHGACAGGGTELALACHWRIATDAAATRIGLPEVGIGTIPGWGGCARLPRLIGAAAAAEHILNAQLISAAEAQRAGLVDELVSERVLKDRAAATVLRFAREGLPARGTMPSPPLGYFTELRRATLAKTRGRLPAPIAAIDAIAEGEGKTLLDALCLEARYFGEVTAGPVCKNLIHVFRLKDRAKKLTLDPWFGRPNKTGAADAARIRSAAGAAEGRRSQAAPPHRGPGRIGVVGAGVMGSGIAQWLAARGHEVVLRDTDAAALKRGESVVRDLFEEAVRRNKLTPDEAQSGLQRVRAVGDWDGFARCDTVIEAVVEDVAVKQALLVELESVVRPETLIASNTSALPIEELSARMQHPGRMLGIHFFNPVSRMPLVELVLGRRTERAAAEAALALVRGLGKTPVVCCSSPGFLVTRVLFFYLNEAVLLWERGVSTTAIDTALTDYGWPMGPLRLIDEIGVDVTAFITGEMARFFPGRFTPATLSGRMNAAGLKGRKNGASSGFYRYDGRKEQPNTAMAALAPGQSVAMEPDKIVQHLMERMVAEARLCLAEGVAQTPDDIDLALLLGAGFPAWRGGLMHGAAS